MQGKSRRTYEPFLVPWFRRHVRCPGSRGSHVRTSQQDKYHDKITRGCAAHDQHLELRYATPLVSPFRAFQPTQNLNIFNTILLWGLHLLTSHSITKVQRHELLFSGIQMFQYIANPNLSSLDFPSFTLLLRCYIYDFCTRHPRYGTPLTL